MGAILNITAGKNMLTFFQIRLSIIKHHAKY